MTTHDSWFWWIPGVTTISGPRKVILKWLKSNNQHIINNKSINYYSSKYQTPKYKNDNDKTRSQSRTWFGVWRWNTPVKEELEDTKRVIRIRNSKDRYHNGQMKK